MSSPYLADIFPILSSCETGPFEHYLKILKTRVKTTSKAIVAELVAFKEAKSKAEVPKAIQIDPEIEKLAKDISQDPILYKRRIDAINKAGVVGERKNIAMYFATLDSRLLPDNPNNPNALATKNSGHFGSGKSFTLMSCLSIYPESSYVLITNGSPKSLYYIKRQNAVI